MIHITIRWLIFNLSLLQELFTKPEDGKNNCVICDLVIGNLASEPIIYGIAYLLKGGRGF